MNYAVLNSLGIVENIIIAASLEVAQTVTNQTCIVDNGTAQIGLKWNGTTFVEPEPVAEIPYPS